MMNALKSTSLSGKEIIAYGLKLKLINVRQHVLGDIIAIEDNQAVLLTYFTNNILHIYMLLSYHHWLRHWLSTTVKLIKPI